MNPRHHNPTKKRRDRFWAHAPYNFVPLPERVVTFDGEIPGHNVYTGHTGYINCMLETRSPLYTRCAVDPEFFAKWSENIREMMKNDSEREQYAQFFHLEDVELPVIPGSSLRGMMRSLVEIVGFGKVQWITGDPLFFRAIGDSTSLGNYYRSRMVREDGYRRSTPLVRAGYMVNRGSRWFIRPAQTIEDTSFARIHRDKIPEGIERWHDCKNAYCLWAKLGKFDYQSVRGGFLHLKYTPVLESSPKAVPNYLKVVLAYSGEMNSKKREVVVFPPDTKAKLIEISDDLLRAYRDQVTQGQQKILGPQGVLKPDQPIFYLIENGRLVFFGHSMLFRLPYESSPIDFVPDKLRSLDSVDIAEAMFGFVPQSKNDTRQARAGRIYFSDAHLEPNQRNVWLKQEAPKILSGPKATTFQHYLTQQVPDEVDSGKRDKRGHPKMELRLDHYASPPPHETTIRGHKLYWHQGSVELREVQENGEVDWKTDTQHTSFKPVNAGITFSFRIYFESLRDFELGALIWALTLPGEADKDYCHSLGMGKPLGLGAVKMTPTLYLSDRTARYTELFAGSNWNLGEKQESNLQQFVRAFETFVIEGLDSRERGQARSLKEVERIKMLLKMMEWPGPDRSLTEYMKIEPTNEYRERPVLPDPLHINAPTGSGRFITQRSRRNRDDYRKDNQRGW